MKRTLVKKVKAIYNGNSKGDGLMNKKKKLIIVTIVLLIIIILSIVMKSMASTNEQKLGLESSNITKEVTEEKDLLNENKIVVAEATLNVDNEITEESEIKEEVKEEITATQPIQEKTEQKTSSTTSSSSNSKSNSKTVNEPSKSQTTVSQQTSTAKQQEPVKNVETKPQSTVPTKQETAYWCVDGGTHHIAGDSANEHGYYSSWNEAYSAFESYTKGWSSVQFKVNSCACGKFYFWAIQ